MNFPSNKRDKSSRPAPSHRHAAPSGPWPWRDLDSDLNASSEPDHGPSCHHTDGECSDCWARYPQSLFPNWTAGQVKRSAIADICARTRLEGPCLLHHVDVYCEGATFSEGKTESISEQNKEEFWRLDLEKKRPAGVRVRALFVDNLSMPVLQMLGTKYQIEPFFFTSSLNWIPSRYQENRQTSKGDHITITLTFLRAKKLANLSSARSSQTAHGSNSTNKAELIDTQAPLDLEDHELQLDLLAVHMVRSRDNSTIITYHPSPRAAKHLHSRVLLAGDSVYWHNIFRQTTDPTFVLLAILWYALYAWDEALETLWGHICKLELHGMSTNNMQVTQELHKIRAHLLHYTSLLDDFRKSVTFVLETRNPTMDSLEENERQASRDLLKNECDNLLMQIERLEMSRAQQDRRLKNVMNLVFSTVNIDDSKTMQKMTEAALEDSAAMKTLTEAAVRDSAAMKQIAYLTMAFLPASFVAGVFGMNIREINPDSRGSLAHYAEVAMPLTIATIWIILAFQGKFHGTEVEGITGLQGVARRLSWPVRTVRQMFARQGARDVQMQDNIRYRTGQVA